MAKNKKDIEDFKKALSSNTEFLKFVQEENETSLQITRKNEKVMALDTIIYRKFKILATYLKKEPHELIHEALNHYLRLKKYHLEQAMLDLTKED